VFRRPPFVSPESVPQPAFPTPEPAGSSSSPAAPSGRAHVDQNPHGKRLAFLTVTALGVVYGDIGTSPLYALQQCFGKDYGLAVTTDNVLGVLSLILWALILVVSAKYLTFIMRADNRGEGGILALLALTLQQPSQGPRRRAVLLAFGLFGAALLYGDGMITPAISVLSAMEGLSEVSPAFGSTLVLSLSAC
jgi:KUP system potassium uptake protein